jgi:hypothetical protein
VAGRRHTGGGGSTGNAGTTGTGGGGSTGSGGSAGTGASGNAGRGGTTGGGGNGGRGGTTGGGGAAAGSTGSAGNTGSAGKGGTTGGGGDTGKAGTGGSGGQAGKGGQGGTGKGGQGGTGGSGLTCAELQTAYAKALIDARMCQANLTVVQCTQLVPVLPCGCQTYVNDRTELDKLKAQWDAAGCQATILCPAIACPAPGKRALRVDEQRRRLPSVRRRSPAPTDALTRVAQNSMPLDGLSSGLAFSPDFLSPAFGLSALGASSAFGLSSALGGRPAWRVRCAGVRPARRSRAAERHLRAARIVDIISVQAVSAQRFLRSFS